MSVTKCKTINSFNVTINPRRLSTNPKNIPSKLPTSISIIKAFSMEKIENATKEVLVDIVKMAQKRGMEGSNGGWKEFLSVYDPRFGKSLCDPGRRSPDALIAFLKTFSNADDLKFFDKMLEKHDTVELIEKKTDKMSPEQELVHKTVAHPHYALSYSFPSHEEGWVLIKNRKKFKPTKHYAMVAVDCEMALCEDGTDALVRVCVVDRDLKVKLDELVKPDKTVVDYRTSITGLAAKDLEQVTCSLQEIQGSMKKFLSKGTILVGHSLNNDLEALKVDHTRVIDTSLIFKYWSGSKFRRPSLKDLCKSVLGYELRKEGAPHDCVEDARAAMKLVLAKLEGRVDKNSILAHQNDVDETNAMKLLCHRIPINISEKTLLEIIPGEFTIELKPNKKAGGDKYSAFTVFKSKQEADEAFEELIGDQDKDSSGYPQKLVFFKLDSGIAGNVYVRKMFRDGEDNNNNNQVASNKRPSEDEIPTQSKKVKIEEETPEPKETIACNNCDSNLKEIETLKKQLSEREREISMLHRIIISQARKQSGL